MAKFRPTKANSVSSLIVEPPFAIAADGNWTRTGSWRHVSDSLLLGPPRPRSLARPLDRSLTPSAIQQTKHAMGENPSRVWGQTRMDSLYDMREIYGQARSTMVAQNEWCELAEAGNYQDLKNYPESSLVCIFLISERTSKRRADYPPRLRISAARGAR